MIGTANLASSLASGWLEANETWSYQGASDPSFTFTISGDKTGKYSPGMRIRLNQTTDKYFLITRVEYSDPNTTITIYGGTDYDLASATISNPFYSVHKAPQGFPLNPLKWALLVSDTTDREQSSPSGGSWYNLGGNSLTLPIGVWRLGYKCCLYVVRNSAAFGDSRSTLSTANNSESDANYSTYNAQSSASGSQQQYAHIQMEHVREVTSPTTYYLNIGTPNNGITAVGIKNIYETTQIYAYCEYL